MKAKLTLQPIYKTSEISQNQGISDIVNSYIDQFGAWRGFPGNTLLRDMGIESPVHLYWWNEKNYLIIITGGRFFYMESELTDPVEVTTPGISEFNTIAFTSTEYRLFFTWGQLVYTWLPGSDVVAVTAGSPPTQASRLAFLDNYIVANNAADNLYYYAVPSTNLNTDEPTWYPGDRAEGLPDNMTAVDCQWRDLLLCGQNSIEIWYNAGNPLPASPFARREGAFIHRGIIAANTLRAIDNNWFFFDSERRMTQLIGSNFKVISGPFDEIFQSLKIVSDAYTFKVSFAGRTWVVLVFPSEDRSFAYEYTLEQWIEISSWDETSGVWLKLPFQTAVYAQEWNQILLGSSAADGKIYYVDSSSYTFATKPIRRLLRTASIDHGTLNRKRCNSLMFRMKRGQDITAGDGLLKIRWKDEGQPWSDYLEVPIKPEGDSNFAVKLFRLGIYRSRQWEFVMSSPADLVVQDIEEDLEAFSG